MSASTPLKDVLKGAREVTSLASTDRVLAFDSNGDPSKISPARLTRRMLEAVSFDHKQWVRIGSCSSMGSAFFSISTVWSSIPGVHLLVDMILHPNNTQYNKVAVLSRLCHSNSTVIDRIRVVCKKSSPVYVDIHFNGDVAHSVFIELLGSRNFSLLPEFEPDAQVPEGFSVGEFSLATVSESADIIGGGNCLPFNRLRNRRERRAA